MEAIRFNFREGVTLEEQESFLNGVRQWPVIKWVGSINPRSTDSLASGICMAT